MLEREYRMLLSRDPRAADDIDTANVLDVIEAEADVLAAWRHPLGFIHVELTDHVKTAPGQRLRFHIWDNEMGARDDLGDWHDHVWHLTSWVLVGQLVDTTYEPVPHPTGDFVGSRVRYGESISSSAAGRFDLALISQRNVFAGTIYTIPSGVVHKSEVAVVPSATLLLSVDEPSAVERGPLVLSPVLAREGATAVRKRVTASEIRLGVRSLRESSTK